VFYGMLLVIKSLVFLILFLLQTFANAELNLLGQQNKQVRYLMPFLDKFSELL